MDLKLICATSTENVYKNRLINALTEISPSLLEQEIWSQGFINTVEKFKNDFVGPKSSISFISFPEIVALELKLYWAKLFCDERNNSRSIVERRLLPLSWLQVNWRLLSEHFGVEVSLIYLARNFLITASYHQRIDQLSDSTIRI